jgi:hypothetical protein
VSCPFEIKYISVTWSDKESIRSITESRSTIPIFEISSREYEVDAITYSKIDDTRTFGRAYSRFKKTEASFINFLNFQSSYDTDSYMKKTSFAPNALFDTLDKRGYVINIFSAGGVDFCDSSKTYKLGRCIITWKGGLKLYHDGLFILYNFTRKMRLLNMYEFVSSKLGMPEVNINMYPNVLKVVTSAEEFMDFLGEGKRGNAYFIHLLLPHSPYFLDETCSFDYDGNFFIK